MEIAGLSGSTRHNLSKEEIEEKSAQLLVKLIRCPDAATREEIYRWIDERPAHAVAFAEAEAAWEAAERLKAGNVETPESIPDDNGALSRRPLTRPDRAVAPEAKRRSP
jgi:ferric-dicitrate binding protein FerR (iron transport regulator)